MPEPNPASVLPIRLDAIIRNNAKRNFEFPEAESFWRYRRSLQSRKPVQIRNRAAARLTLGA